MMVGKSGIVSANDRNMSALDGVKLRRAYSCAEDPEETTTTTTTEAPETTTTTEAPSVTIPHLLPNQTVRSHICDYRTAGR